MITNADWEATQVSDQCKKIQKYTVYLADQSGFSKSLRIGQIPYYDYDRVVLYPLLTPMNLNQVNWCCPKHNLSCSFINDIAQTDKYPRRILF